jgi:hypothetical protein
MKKGAFTPCLKCGFMPETSADEARSMTLSDHNIPADQLAEIGARIAAGQPVKFDEEAISQMAGEFDEVRKQGPARRALGCLIIKWGLLAILVGLAVSIAVMIWYLKRRG